MDVEEIDAIEAEYWGRGGKPTLGRSYELLMDRWKSGYRNRETALRLLFLMWYSQSESSFSTGLTLPLDQRFVKELFLAIGGENVQDDEACFVIGVITEIAPFYLGNEKYWTAVGKMLRTRLSSRPSLIDPRIFEGRGTYGEYFAHQLRCLREG